MRISCFADMMVGTTAPCTSNTQGVKRLMCITNRRNLTLCSILAQERRYPWQMPAPQRHFPWQLCPGIDPDFISKRSRSWLYSPVPLAGGRHGQGEWGRGGLCKTRGASAFSRSFSDGVFCSPAASHQDLDRKLRI